ncbi:MAG: AzlC family ABC transporter permease [Actinomycetaceae bacterium]|nr:AzlC family ABC transporter permease [Actinomycetaceae bacterium]
MARSNRCSNTPVVAGIRASMPIALGYFAVSLAVGLYWDTAAFPPLSSTVFSALNMSSTGQFAAISIMAAKGGFIELAATTLLVNLRYFLMSISLSQRLDSSFSTWRRFILAFGITDEIYALNISQKHLTFTFAVSSMILPIIGWTGGTVTGAFMGQALPQSVQSAAGILLFAMFIAIVIPPTQASCRVQIVVALAALTSVALAYLPLLSNIDIGWRIIIATCVAAAIGATFFPVTASGEPASSKEKPCRT